MLKNLIHSFHSLVDFTDQEITYILSYFKTKSIPKYEKIFISGETTRNLYFINSGLVRIFYNAPDKEITLDVLKENEWLTDYLSYIMGTPIEYDAEALENTELFYISYDSCKELLDKFVNFERYYRLYSEMLFLRFLTYETASKVRNSTERYLLFQQMRPEIFDRTPLKYVADMLDIEQGTLSRIRKNLSDQST